MLCKEFGFEEPHPNKANLSSFHVQPITSGLCLHTHWPQPFPLQSSNLVTNEAATQIRKNTAQGRWGGAETLPKSVILFQIHFQSFRNAVWYSRNQYGTNQVWIANFSNFLLPSGNIKHSQWRNRMYSALAACACPLQADTPQQNEGRELCPLLVCIPPAYLRVLWNVPNPPRLAFSLDTLESRMLRLIILHCWVVFNCTKTHDTHTLPVLLLWTCHTGVFHVHGSQGIVGKDFSRLECNPGELGHFLRLYIFSKCLFCEFLNTKRTFHFWPPNLTLR